MSAASPSDSKGGDALSTFVEKELETERDRRKSINERGAGLITTSSALAALLFAASAVVTGQTNYAPPRLAIWTLVVTAIAFVAAALCGLLALRTVAADVVSTPQLVAWRRRDDVWLSSGSEVQRLLTKANTWSLATIRAGNNSKMKWARRGFVAQLLALVSLAVVVFTILVAAALPDFVDICDKWTAVCQTLRPPGQ